jgi:hypothetical protein
MKFFYRNKIGLYQKWLKKIDRYFGGKQISTSKLWKFLTDDLILNDGEDYKLKCSVFFIYKFFWGYGFDNLNPTLIEEMIKRFDERYTPKDIVKIDVLSDFIKLPNFLIRKNSENWYGGGSSYSDVLSNSEFVVYDVYEIEDAFEEAIKEYVNKNNVDELEDVEGYLDFVISYEELHDLIHEVVINESNKKNEKLTDEELTNRVLRMWDVFERSPYYFFHYELGLSNQDLINKGYVVFREEDYINEYFYGEWEEEYWRENLIGGGTGEYKFIHNNELYYIYCIMGNCKRYR